MKIGIVGTRGIPAKYGGFETFAEEISPRLLEKGFKLQVFCELNGNINLLNEYRGVRLSYLPIKKSTNPLLYYLISIFMACKHNDIIIITGSPGSNFFFIKYLFWPNKKIIIVNPDGLEFLRAKWSNYKQLFLKFSDYITARFADYIIADSKGIKDYFINKYLGINSDKIIQIEYGALTTETNFLYDSDYYLVVARFEPENNLEMIIKGFLQSETKKKLYIVGNLINNAYVKKLLIYRSDKVIFLNGVYNKEDLLKLRCNCFSYIHGHSVGGTNPSLLEAMGSGNITICHDNIFNREVTDNKMFYFKDAQSLSVIISKIENMDICDLQVLATLNKDRIKNYYNWERITESYSQLIGWLVKFKTSNKKLF